MPRGQHPNSLKNLKNGKPFCEENARKNQKKSVISRKQNSEEKRTIREIVVDILKTMASDNPQWSSIAGKYGISSDTSVKELITAVCMLNTLKRGGLDDVQKLIEIIGENNALGNGQQPEDDPLTKALREEAEKFANL